MAGVPFELTQLIVDQEDFRVDLRGELFAEIRADEAVSEGCLDELVQQQGHLGPGWTNE